MGLKIGKNWKPKPSSSQYNSGKILGEAIYKQKIHNSSSNASNNLFNPYNVSNDSFNPNYVAQINYFGIVSELPDVNEAELGQLVLKQDNDNYIAYIFNGKSWVELAQSMYDIKIESADDYTDIYGNNSWRTYVDNRITCDVRLKDEPIYDRDYI